MQYFMLEVDLLAETPEDIESDKTKIYKFVEFI